jgi:hypothetical protein
MTDFNLVLGAAPEAPAVVPSLHLGATERAQTAVTAWFVEHMHDSPVSRQTDCINHILTALPDLVARIAKEFE